MYNRYDGKTGKYVRVEDAPASPHRSGNASPAPQSKRRRDPAEILSGIIPNAVASLDTEDIILLLVLYLMYRESGDKDLLITMGSLFLP